MMPGMRGLRGIAIGLLVAACCAAQAPAAFAAPQRHTHFLGHSVRGRPIWAVEIGNPAAPRKVLVVGCIHGNEPAGIAVARRLQTLRPPTGTVLWIVNDLNPDGYAAHTRHNARRVDLNRNFPYNWRPIGSPGSVYYSGPRPASEPETQIAMHLILTLHPRLTIWYHQAMRLVDESGGRLALEQRYAQLVGLPLRRLPAYNGTATSWENHRMPGTTSFVVELPGGTLPSTSVTRHAHAVLSLAAMLR